MNLTVAILSALMAASSVTVDGTAWTEVTKSTAVGLESLTFLWGKIDPLGSLLVRPECLDTFLHKKLQQGNFQSRFGSNYVWLPMPVAGRDIH